MEVLYENITGIFKQLWLFCNLCHWYYICYIFTVSNIIWNTAQHDPTGTEFSLIIEHVIDTHKCQDKIQSKHIHQTLTIDSDDNIYNDILSIFFDNKGRKHQVILRNEPCFLVIKFVKQRLHQHLWTGRWNF